MESQIPEGYEWPKFENLEPVRIGDWFTDRAGKSSTVKSLLFVDGSVAVESKSNLVTYYSYGERVKRPVLAADGKPLEVGQTVWHTKTGTEYRVLSLPDGEKGAWLENSGGKYFLDYAVLTHQRPVLDADGVPVELGDDLYSVEGGLKLRVSNIDRVNCRIATSAMFALDKWADPSMFTHTKPEMDTWERIEEDATLSPEVYCHRNGIDISQKDGTEIFLADTVEPMARDLVRRCREVAERERDER